MSENLCGLLFFSLFVGLITAAPNLSKFWAFYIRIEKHFMIFRLWASIWVARSFLLFFNFFLMFKRNFWKFFHTHGVCCAFSAAVTPMLDTLNCRSAYSVEPLFVKTENFWIFLTFVSAYFWRIRSCRKVRFLFLAFWKLFVRFLMELVVFFAIFITFWQKIWCEVSPLCRNFFLLPLARPEITPLLMIGWDERKSTDG